jgi:hypothetical protein
MEEQASSPCTQRCSRDREKKPKGPMTRLNEATLLMKSVYEIGPPSWIKKQINANTLKELVSTTIIYTSDKFANRNIKLYKSTGFDII